MEPIRKNLENKKIEKWFSKDNLIILILAGVLLLVINLPTKESEGEGRVVDESMVTQVKMQEESKFSELYEYAEYLEEKLETVLMNMKGVGKVQVMITLDTSEELVVEKDETNLRDDTRETDNAGGNRKIERMERGQETVYIKQGKEEIPYVTKTLLPQISGVLILAQGAGQGNNNKTILEIAQALFGIEAHKVKVVIME